MKDANQPTTIVEAIALLVRVEAKIDSILRGDHNGWDAAMSALRAELQEAIKDAG